MDETREEGWRILRTYSETRYIPKHTDPVRREMRELDEWENRWFPVVRAVQRARYPKVLAKALGKLSQTSGRQLYLSVPFLIEAIRELNDAPAGSEEAAARAYLARRGLTEQVLAEGEALATSSLDPEAIERASEVDERRAAAKEAEAELWRWYLEWSEISRAAISDEKLLKVLGFGKPGRPRGATAKKKGARGGAKKKGASRAKGKKR